MNPRQPRARIELFESVPSTNDTILEAGASGAPEGLTHVALAQTRGRGRESRTWWSPAGAGLWMSTLLRPAPPRERWAQLALVAGTAVRRTVAELGVRAAELEWPNDVVVHGRKLGGLLCEVRSDGRSAWVALGIGLNIDLTSSRARASLPAELRDRVTCLSAEGPPSVRDPEALAGEVLERLWPLYDRFLAGERPSEIAGADLAHAGRPVRVQLADGSVLRGRVHGLGAGGELLVRTPSGGVEPVIAGDVEYLRDGRGERD